MSRRHERRRVTFSRNLTLSLSRTCRCHCKYCAFATHKPHLHEPEEVERLIDRAARRSVKELLVLTGEAPDTIRASRAARRARLRGLHRLRRVGVRAGARARAAAAHQPRRARAASDLARLREVTASQGLMLESINPDLVAHQGSPTKHPAAAAGDDPRRRRAEDPVHERDPGRHRRVRGGPDGVARGARRASTTSRRSSSRTSSRTGATTARSRPRSPTDAAERYWRTGLGDAPQRDAPEVGLTPVDDRGHEAADRRDAAADARTSASRCRRTSPTGGRSSSRAGATDLGGLSRQRRPHLARAPVPVARSRSASGSPRTASR